MTPVSHKTIEANGLRFAYFEQGSGPLVLLLHGFPDTAYTWDAVLPALAEAGYRAVAPFMRGYAPTEIPADGDFSAEALAKDAIGLIGALGGGPAIVVGHDWGASAAYSAATLGPEHIRLLVTMAIPYPGAITPTPKLVWTLRHFFTLRKKNAAAAVEKNDFAYVDELYRRWSPAWKDIPASETARVKAVFREPGCTKAACAYYRVQGLRVPKSQKLPITVPTIAFAGEHDNIHPRTYEKARHKFKASYEVVQVPGGHFMHREHPEPFRSELVRVLRDHDRAK